MIDLSDNDLDPISPWQRVKADNPPRMEDLERWEGLLRCELERVLSIFLPAREASKAVGDIGTPDFDPVLAYLRRVKEREEMLASCEWRREE